MKYFLFVVFELYISKVSSFKHNFFNFPNIKSSVSRFTYTSLSDNKISNLNDCLSKSEHLVVLWHEISEKQSELNVGLNPDDDEETIGICNHFNFCIEKKLLPYELIHQNDKIYTLNFNGKEKYKKMDSLSSPMLPEAEDVIKYTQNWVKKMIADFSVCPYTINENIAGIPKGNIRYSLSEVHNSEEAMRDFWAEVYGLLSTNEADISTVLLVYNSPLLFADVTEFESFCECLDNSLIKSSANFGDQIQLVYFHPEFKFKDKNDQVIVIFDDDGNPVGLSNELVKPIDFSRRSPWPIINILRSPQVNALQKHVPEGKIARDNKARLDAVGTNELQDMLDKRNWQNLPIYSAYSKLNK